MKIGRNDPCHCGSGKKYKRCCLQTDRSQVRAKPAIATEPSITDDIDMDAEPSLEALVEQATLAPAMMSESEDPLMAAIYDFYDAYMAATYADRWFMATDMLVTRPELCDSEMAFEIVNMLFDEAMKGGDHGRFMTLLAEIETQAPQAWDSNLNLMLEWRAVCALMAGDDEAVREAFIALSDVAGRDLDTYYRALSQFAWHGDLDLLVVGLRRALPSVKASDKLVSWAAGELAEQVATFDLFQTILTGAPSSEWEPVLADRFTHEYELSISEHFALALAYYAGEKTPATDMEAYVLDPKAKDEDDSDPGRIQLNFLIDGLCRYAWSEKGMPLSRIAQVREHIGQYLILSGLGQLAKPKKKRSRSRRAKPGSQKPYLIPQRKQADAFISEHMITLLYTPIHNMAAFVELLVILLDYLTSLQMVTVRQVEDARADLKPLIGSVAVKCDAVTCDPAPGKHLRTLLR